MSGCIPIPPNDNFFRQKWKKIRERVVNKNNALAKSFKRCGRLLADAQKSGDFKQPVGPFRRPIAKWHHGVVAPLHRIIRCGWWRQDEVGISPPASPCCLRNTNSRPRSARVGCLQGLCAPTVSTLTSTVWPGFTSREGRVPPKTYRRNTLQAGAGEPCPQCREQYATERIKLIRAVVVFMTALVGLAPYLLG